ncbi:MAG: DNA-directed RNA polymerase [Thaumarchaeota archaeon]|nr:DNA-directed RNA polymerase [Nitrososphaerota archaeon]
MFQIASMSDVIRVSPEKFGSPLRDVALEVLKSKYESTISPEMGYIILITDVGVEKVGKIIPGDGARYHKVDFAALSFYPMLQEVVEGEVVEITDFGAFVRLGPADALLHLSQITDDYLTSDVKQGVILASQTKRTLKVGSKVRVRITAISLGRGVSMGKIGVTCRQPFLGALEWIEDDIAKSRKGGAPSGKQPKESEKPSKEAKEPKEQKKEQRKK